MKHSKKSGPAVQAGPSLDYKTELTNEEATHNSHASQAALHGDFSDLSARRIGAFTLAA